MPPSINIKDLCKRNSPIIIEDILKDPRVEYPQEVWDEGTTFIVEIPLV